MTEWSEKRTSEIKLSDDMTFVMRQRLANYALRKINGLKSAKAEDWGSGGNVLTVSPSVHPQQLETLVYAFQQDYHDGNVK